jgi:hypothetical protein
LEPIGESSLTLVANIQSRIVAIGREALSQNAEWLITTARGRSSR